MPDSEARREFIGKQLIALALWAAAFAFVEAAVVVYLRKLFYPGGFEFPLKPQMIESILGVEIAREAATMAMLALVAWLAGAPPQGARGGPAAMRRFLSIRLSGCG